MRFHSFFEMISYYAERTPEAPALRYESGGVLRTMSFAALRSAVIGRTAFMQEEDSSCEGIFADGGIASVIEIFAAAKMGRQMALLDENAPDALLREQIRNSDVDLLFGDGDLVEELEDSMTGGLPEEEMSRPGDVKMLFFTSGTTERSKAVVLTEESFMASAYNGGALLPLEPEDRLLCLLPMSHVFGFVCGLLWGLSCGASVALGRGPRHYIDDCAYFKPTAISAVPLLWGFLLKYKALNPELKLVLIGAGDCPAPLLQAAKALGIRLSFGYGLTETSSGIALSLGEDPYAMTVCPDDTVKIAEDGEILIQAPTCVMRGYYKRPADTAAVLKDGWLFTGDLGRIDEAGFLRITGRKKEMLVLQDGTKIFLPEYEAALGAALGTQELAVGLDQSGKLTLVLGQQAEGDDKEILSRLQPLLGERPRGQQISRVKFDPAPLPRTQTGKLKRWEIRYE
jgi:long-subunit acyl-CoA synthetase (AMP-forming)